MNPANALSQLSPGMAECHARLMAVAKHGTTEAFSATLAGVLQRAELSISNAYDAGAKSIQVTNQQGAPEALPEPSPDQLRAIARTARNSSGSTSDDCGPLAYALHGWRAAVNALRTQQPAPSAAAVHAETMRKIGEAQAFEAWFKVDCPVEGANARIAAKAAWQARAALDAPQPSPTAQADSVTAPAAGAVAGKWPVGWSVSCAGDAWTVVAPDGQRRVWHEKTTSHDDSVFMWAFLEALNGPRPSPTDWAAVSNPAYAELPESLMLEVDRWFADNTGLGGCSGKDVRELAQLFYEVAHEGGRESVDDALAIVESFGPGISGLNDTYARQVLLAEEVKRLRASHGQAPAGAAPECLTCSDHGAVGNILTAEPCPDCTRLNAQPAPATQQAGWKCAPVEPTDAMVQAAHHIDLSYMPGQEGADRAAIYRAMLAAAPHPSPTAQADSAPAHQWDTGYPPLPRPDLYDSAAGTVGWSEGAMQGFVDADRAARTPADSQPAPARDYPPLPEPDLGMPWRVNAKSDGAAHSSGFTCEQMRAYVDADRAARAPADSVTAPAVGYRISDPREPDLGHWLSEEPGAAWCVSEPLALATSTPPTHATKAGNQQEARPCHVFTVRKAGGLTEWEPTSMAFALPDGAHALYTLHQPTPAAQAADSVTAPAYSIDADPQGIRARVAEAISGALAFGAQGANPPPTGHWLVPFWEQAREEASHNRPVSSDTLYLLRRLLSNQHTLTSAEFREELTKIVGEAAQAADSVLEDAARLDFLQLNGSTLEVLPAAEFGAAWCFRVGGLHKAVSSDLRAAIDAARKQGGA